MTHPAADRCPSVLVVHDRAASLEASCALDPAHGGDHQSATIRWPRLRQSDGQPLTGRLVGSR